MSDLSWRKSVHEIGLVTFPPLPLPSLSFQSPPLPVYLVCGFNLDVVRGVWSGDKLSTPLLHPRNVLLSLQGQYDKPGVADGGILTQFPVGGF